MTSGAAATALQRNVAAIVNVARIIDHSARSSGQSKRLRARLPCSTVLLIESGLLDGSVVVVVEPTPYHDTIVAQAHLIDMSI